MASSQQSVNKQKRKKDVQTTELRDDDEIFIFMYFSIYLLGLDILAAQSFPMQQQS